MAASTVSKLLRQSLPKTHFKPFSSSSTSSSSAAAAPQSLNHPVSSDTDSDSDTTVPTLSPEESHLADQFHALIKSHHRQNPNPNPYRNPNPTNPNLTIPSLSLSFSRLLLPSSPLSSSLLCHVIQKSSAPRHGTPFLPTLAFFNWASQVDVDRGGNNDRVINSDVYNEMIDFAGKMRRFDVAWHLVDKMRSTGVQIGADTFFVLIRRYVRAGMGSEAIHAFNRMEEFGVVPDRVAFSVVVSSLCKKRRAEEAQAFFDSGKERFGLDVVVYTSLVNGWCRAGKMDEAEKVFREMKVAGIEPNVNTYSVVIDGLCRDGQISRAHDVLAEMIERGCEPNSVTFNNLMRVHVKAGRTEKVLQVYNQMVRIGCNCDTVTYNFIIDAHCRDGSRDEAIKLLNQMVMNSCPPNAHTFNPIFSCISKSGDVNAAHRLFDKMKELKCEPNMVTYNTLMKMFAGSKSTNMVLKLRKEMDDEGIEPNVNTYRILISVYCGMGHWNNAYKVLREMIEEKCMKPSKPVYEMVLQQLRKAEQMKKHEELVEKMVARGFVTRPL